MSKTVRFNLAPSVENRNGVKKTDPNGDEKNLDVIL